MVVGEDLSSIVTSPHAKLEDGSNEFCVGTVISPERKNPKKQRVAADQSMIVSAGASGDVGFQ